MSTNDFFEINVQREIEIEEEKVKENFCSLQVKIKFGSESASNCSESATLVYHLQELVEQYSSVVIKPKAADAAVLSSNSNILL